MGLFKKKGSEIIDYTELQKRGILKRRQEISIPEKYEGQTLDLTSQKQNSFPTQETVPNSSFDFLDNFAQSSAVLQTESAPNFLTAQQDTEFSKKINELNLKIDDQDYKIDSLIERVRDLEKKIESLGRV